MRLAYIDVETTRQVAPRVIQVRAWLLRIAAESEGRCRSSSRSVFQIMAHHLGWSKARCEQEAAELEQLLQTMSRKGRIDNSIA